jgi:hypothetical protein
MSNQDAFEVPFRTLAHGNAANEVGGLFFLRSQEVWAAEWHMLHSWQGSEARRPPQ